jgi:hypothetical protein
MFTTVTTIPGVVTNPATCLADYRAKAEYENNLMEQQEITTLKIDNQPKM